MTPEVNEYQNHKMRMVGIYSKNREEWMIVDVGCAYLYGLTVIPLYDTLGPDSISHCLRNSGVFNMIASQNSVDVLLQTKDLANLKYIIAIDEIT